MTIADHRKAKRAPVEQSQDPDRARDRVGPKRWSFWAGALSIVLHCALIVALLTVRLDPAIPVITPSVINVELWQLADGLDFESREASVDTGGEAPQTSGANEITELPDPDTRPVETETIVPEPRTEASVASESAPVTLPVEDEQADVSFEGREEAPLEPAAPPVIAAEIPPTSSDDTIAVEAEEDQGNTGTVSTAEPVAATRPEAVTVAESGQPQVSEDGPVSETPAPLRIPVPEAEQRMLENRLQRLARNFDRAAQMESPQSWEHDGVVYSAEVTQLPIEGDMGIERVAIKVSTEVDGDRFSTELSMMRMAFSSFAHFIDRWDPNVQMHDDVIEGRFHSNSEIAVSSSGNATPQFLGKVTTASRSINTSNSRRRVRRDEVFLGGLETGAGRIALAKGFETMLEDAALSERAHRFAEDTRITFYADGSYGWTAVDSEEPEQRRSLPQGSAYLLAGRKAQLHVKGVVNGAVLVYSPERIVIEGDLIYALNADMTTDPSDFLGLVSEKSVEIAPPDITGPGNLTVNASIYAKRRFVVSRYRSRQDATLLIHGSLAAGSVSASEPRFAMQIRYDPRLRTVRPPSFPTTDRYELEPWEAEWELETL